MRVPSSLRAVLMVLAWTLAALPAAAQTCRWDGTAPFCAGSCGGAESEITRLDALPDFWEPPFSNVPEFGAACVTGSKALCCDTPGTSCRWDGTAPFCEGGCGAGETAGTPPPGSSSGAACLTGSKAYCCRSTGPTGSVRAALEASPEYVAYAAIWVPDPGVPWQARHGISSGDYQALVDELALQGFRPVEVSGYALGGASAFATVWVQAEGPPWVARHDLSPQGYQAEFDRLAAEGFRPVILSGYVVAGQELYAAVWEQRPGPAWVARHGLTAADYQAEFDRLLAEGFRLIDISGYAVNGEDRYAAIWEANDGRAWAGRHNLSAEQYQQEFNALAGQGFQPVAVATWPSPGGPRYAAVWEGADGSAWVARHGMLADAYQEEFERLLSEGFRPRSIAGHHVLQ